jgi:hypothetical protein
MTNRTKPMLAALLALAVCACSGVTRLRDAAGQAAIGGFSYLPPGPGWRGTRYPPSASGLRFHHYRRDGDRLQFQLSEVQPAGAVADQAAVTAWAARVGGGRAVAASGHGAICARYSHRWQQTLSLGGPPQPWATIEERGLFCIDSEKPDRLVHVRVFERLLPDGEASPGFESLAERLLAGVRARLVGVPAAAPRAESQG